MSNFKIIAKWIYSECSDPISEIEWLLKTKYLNEDSEALENNSKLLEDYADVIKHIEEREEL